MKAVRGIGLGALAVGILFAGACGSTVTGTGSGTAGAGNCSLGDPNISECSGGATTGPGGFGTTGPGAGGASTAGTGGFAGAGGCATFVCCTSPQQVCCMPCDTSVTTVTTGTSGTSGAGGGQLCGGFVGAGCPTSDYCLYPDHLCGGNDDSGTCQPRPGGCPQIFDPVCGCDGKVYGNACMANGAGVDVSDLGNCKPPQGMFGCGAGFCQLSSEYCMVVPSGVENGATTYTCEPFPNNCGVAPGCACLGGVTCGGNCQVTAEGGLEVTCLTE